MCVILCLLYDAVNNAESALFVWWETITKRMKEEWKFVWEESGGQCVKIHGTTRMLRWSADSWDTVQKVSVGLGKIVHPSASEQ